MYFQRRELRDTSSSFSSSSSHRLNRRQRRRTCSCSLSRYIFQREESLPSVRETVEREKTGKKMPTTKKTLLKNKKCDIYTNDEKELQTRKKKKRKRKLGFCLLKMSFSFLVPRLRFFCCVLCPKKFFCPHTSIYKKGRRRVLDRKSASSLIQKKCLKSF